MDIQCNGTTERDASQLEEVKRYRNQRTAHVGALATMLGFDSRFEETVQHRAPLHDLRMRGQEQNLDASRRLDQAGSLLMSPPEQLH